MSSLFAGPSALSPWIEQEVYLSLLNKHTKTTTDLPQQRPRLVQVVSLIYQQQQQQHSSNQQENRSSNINIPICLRISDGTTTILAALSPSTRQGLASSSSSTTEDAVVLPTVGCVVRISQWTVSCQSLLLRGNKKQDDDRDKRFLFQPSDFIDRFQNNNNRDHNGNNSNNNDPKLCLYVTGTVETMFGHGMSLVGKRLVDVYDALDVRRALSSVVSLEQLHERLLAAHEEEHHERDERAEPHGRVQRQPQDTDAPNILDEPCDKPASAGCKQPPTSSLPIGNVAALLEEQNATRRAFYDEAKKQLLQPQPNDEDKQSLLVMPEDTLPLYSLTGGTTTTTTTAVSDPRHLTSLMEAVNLQSRMQRIAATEKSPQAFTKTTLQGRASIRCNNYHCLTDEPMEIMPESDDDEDDDEKDKDDEALCIRNMLLLSSTQQSQLAIVGNEIDNMRNTDNIDKNGDDLQEMGETANGRNTSQSSGVTFDDAILETQDSQQGLTSSKINHPDDSEHEALGDNDNSYSAGLNTQRPYRDASQTHWQSLDDFSNTSNKNHVDHEEIREEGVDNDKNDRLDTQRPYMDVQQHLEEELTQVDKNNADDNGGDRNFFLDSGHKQHADHDYHSGMEDLEFSLGTHESLALIDSVHAKEPASPSGRQGHKRRGSVGKALERIKYRKEAVAPTAPAAPSLSDALDDDIERTPDPDVDANNASRSTAATRKRPLPETTIERWTRLLGTRKHLRHLHAPDRNPSGKRLGGDGIRYFLSL